MADRKIYIDNGTNLGWDTQIITSRDGVTWESFPKAGMKVTVHQLNMQASYPTNVNVEPSGDVIILQNVDDDTTYARFHLQNVVNQTWATAQDALNDINTWLVS